MNVLLKLKKINQDTLIDNINIINELNSYQVMEKQFLY